MKRISFYQDCSVRTICSYVVCRAIMGFQRKRWKISKVTDTAIRFLLLTSTKFAVRAACIFEQQNKEFVIQILYLMVLLCVIFKRVWYAWHFECSCKQCSFSTENNLQSDFKKLQEKLLTINKRNKVRGNTYRDNNFHLRRQVLRLKCLWKSWVMQALAYKQPCRFML